MVELRKLTPAELDARMRFRPQATVKLPGAKEVLIKRVESVLAK